MQERRLGLALSGGGFRASLFHLGVLKRLAELGLLRHVTQISTVSGGSIVAALYYLHFKRVFEASEGRIAPSEYASIVARVESDFIAGVKQDIRNRLLMSPFAQLRELISGNGFGQKMARLYTKHFYRRAIEEVFWKVPEPLLKRYRSRGVPLHRLIVRLPAQPEELIVNRSSGYPNVTEPEIPIADFNESRELASIPSLVINSTCLNTGGPFYFTFNEVGGPGCGFVRTDEVFMILQYKVLLEGLGDEPVDGENLARNLEVALDLGKHMEDSQPELPQTAFRRTSHGQPAEQCFPRHTFEHLCFYQAARARMRKGDDIGSDSWVPEEFKFETEDLAIEGLKQTRYWSSVRRLMEVDFGLLRKAKLAAWVLLDRIGWQGRTRRGGFTREEYEAHLMWTLREIDDQMAHDFTDNGKLTEGMEELIVVLYYLRTASVLNRRAYEVLNWVTLSHAVAASANFPPMFTPFKINDLFESRHLNAVHLTDGGVHDNQGTEWLIDAGCTDIIASDAGGLVCVEPKPAEARLPMMDRIIDVLMGGVRRFVLRHVDDTVLLADLCRRIDVVAADEEKLTEFRRSTHLKKAVVIPIGGQQPLESDYLKPFEAQLVASLRTDLDAFNELEIAALRYQGYQLTDFHARPLADGDFKEPGGYPPPASPVTLPARPTELHRRILTAGRHRAARYSVAYPLRAAIFAALIALAFWQLAAHLHDWTSWSSIHKLASVNVLKDTDLKTPAQVLFSKPYWKPLHEIREKTVEKISQISVIALLFGGWAIFLVSRVLFRASHGVRKRVMLEVKLLLRRKTFSDNLQLLKRPTNVISLTALLLFFATFNVGWLFGVLYLWTFFVALFFVFVHLVFTRLWLSAGKIDNGSPPGAAAKAPAPRPAANAA